MGAWVNGLAFVILLQFLGLERTLRWIVVALASARCQWYQHLA